MKPQNLNYTHLPPWLESNFFFRKIFLFRKLFLTKTKFKHFSQFAEDVFIGRLFPGISDGFFVDVGCFHPKKYNNTWMLYKRGWRGINIDIDSIKIEGFEWIRPQDTNVNCAVSNQSGEFTFYSNGFYSLTASLDEEFAKGKPGYIPKTVQCKSLTEIIAETSFKGVPIDFLSVDAEGHDLEVLKSLDFEQYSPKLIAVETALALMTELSESMLYQFLTEKGYCLVGWTGLTFLMASPAMQQKLAKVS
jgi:FkbM family methyltransferase